MYKLQATDAVTAVDLKTKFKIDSINSREKQSRDINLLKYNKIFDVNLIAIEIFNTFARHPRILSIRVGFFPHSFW